MSCKKQSVFANWAAGTRNKRRQRAAMMDAPPSALLFAVRAQRSAGCRFFLPRCRPQVGRLSLLRAPTPATTSACGNHLPLHACTYNAARRLLHVPCTQWRLIRHVAITLRSSASPQPRPPSSQETRSDL